MPKQAPARKRKAAPRRSARKVCLLCGAPLSGLRSARLAHLLEYHTDEEPDLILDQYDSMLAGVPQMEAVIERASLAAQEVLELERMFSLPSRRSRR